MKVFTTKPVTVKAVQFTREMAEGSETLPEGVKFRRRTLGGNKKFYEYPHLPKNFSNQHEHVVVRGEEEHRVEVGDWVVSKHDGLYVYTSEEFVETYESREKVIDYTKAQYTINLGLWQNDGKSILVGRENGEDFRNVFELHEEDSNPEPIIIQVPEHTYITTSWMMGAFGPSAKKLGKTKFLDKYLFTGKDNAKQFAEDLFRIMHLFGGIT